MKRLILVAPTLLLLGCFKYAPIDLRQAPTGEQVRVSVTRLGAAQLSEVTTDGQAAPRMSGVVEGRDGADLLLRVRVGDRQEGIHPIGIDQTIRVPEGEILAMERREFDPVGSTAIIAAAAGGAAFLILSIMDAFGGPSDQDEGPDLFHSLVRIPIG